MHLEADELSTIHVQNHVKIKPLAHDPARQEREIPTPQLSRGCSHVRARRAHPLRCFTAASMTNLSLRSQHASVFRDEDSGVVTLLETDFEDSRFGFICSDSAMGGGRQFDAVQSCIRSDIRAESEW